mmetsp:Transcript_12128/g.34363  ORF Transcript_12128/g.34363 Transcript_12128/m.34363 type:complete len:181 (-) Transcript_12128:724-1266(-)
MHWEFLDKPPNQDARPRQDSDVAECSSLLVVRRHQDSAVEVLVVGRCPDSLVAELSSPLVVQRCQDFAVEERRLPTAVQRCLDSAVEEHQSALLVQQCHDSFDEERCSLLAWTLVIVVVNTLLGLLSPSSAGSESFVQGALNYHPQRGTMPETVQMTRHACKLVLHTAPTLPLQGRLAFL